MPPQSKWRGDFGAQGIGNRKREAAVDDDAIGEATVAADTSLDDVGAEVLVAALTPLALKAAPALPADTDPSAQGRGA